MSIIEFLYYIVFNHNNKRSVVWKEFKENYKKLYNQRWGISENQTASAA